MSNERPAFRESFQKNIIEWGGRALIGLALVAALEATPVAAQTEEETMISRVNDRRESFYGLPRLGVAPGEEGTAIQKALGDYLAQLRDKWKKTGQLFPGGSLFFPENAGTYMRSASGRVRYEGEVYAFPAGIGEEDLWVNKHEVANAWMLEIEHSDDESTPADVVYAPTTANAIACVENTDPPGTTAVLCATFRHPAPVAATIVEP